MKYGHWVDADVRTERPWPSEFVALLPGSGNPLNQAGLRDFLRFAWPRVKTLVPDATLRVAGSVGRVVPPGTAGVTVLGHVPDLAAEYESARVVINPAVAGTGLRSSGGSAGPSHARGRLGHNRDGLSERLSAYVDEVRDWQEFADAVAKRLLASQSPIDADGITAITGELSADAIYRALPNGSTGSLPVAHHPDRGYSALQCHRRADRPIGIATRGCA